MTTIDFAAAPMRSAPRQAVAIRAINWLATSYRAWKNRRAFYHLGELSDVELQDIGLTRTDLSVAVGFGDDPTTYLGAIAQSRADRMELRTAM
jgi:uncharacterized protein YjiS (DUF1127 family)